MGKNVRPGTPKSKFLPGMAEGLHSPANETKAESQFTLLLKTDYEHTVNACLVTSFDSTSRACTASGPRNEIIQFE